MILIPSQTQSFVLVLKLRSSCALQHSTGSQPHWLLGLQYGCSCMLAAYTTLPALAMQSLEASLNTAVKPSAYATCYCQLLTLWCFQAVEAPFARILRLA